MSQADEVVLLDEDGVPVGTAPRGGVHGPDTPLHLAFSCYLFDRAGRVLLTRRALAKQTWPGVWTNSCCGHPRPGEDPAAAVRRRVREELGLRLLALRVALPDFRYRAERDGVVENEVCPVYTAVVDADPEPDPAEVVEWRWVDWRAFVSGAEHPPDLSPWCRDQLPGLRSVDVPWAGPA